MGSKVMKRSNVLLKVNLLLLSATLLFTSCASTTMIESIPSGAKVYTDGEYLGETPYPYKDTKIVGSCTSIELKKEGYEPFVTNLCRNEQADVGAIIAGVFFLVPFLWTMKYKPTHDYELVPKPNKQANSVEK